MRGNEHSPADEIFNAALELDTAERADFINRVCLRQTVLGTEVHSLLKAFEDANGFLERPLIAPPAENSVDIEEPGYVGTLAGPYRLVSLIASGGMGAVYKARREDSSFPRHVAVKLIRQGMMNDEARRRFHRERQALIRLEHPYIAALLDGGDTDQRMPYLAMELICGLPVTEYCDQRRLGIRPRLELFCKICEAVHFAHCNLIVHRDLKPANILVTSEGTPKLLDFGIARLLGEDGDTAELNLTQTALRWLTPRYASPEQIRGSGTTTACDVYSLGIVLYELLTGQSPYELDGKTRYEQERIICEVPPDAPSERVKKSAASNLESFERIALLRSERPSRLSRVMRGDLDNIVLTALQKEAQRRYASIQQFKEDIERYLADLPIIARKDSMRYRVGKYISRNKAACIAAAVCGLALLVAVAGTSAGMIRARRASIEANRERNAAVRAESDAYAVTKFLQDLFAAANPYSRAGDATIYDLLQDAERRIAPGLSERPGVEAGVRLAIANTYAGMWEWEKAIPHLRIALSINRRLHGIDDPRVAECLSVLGRALTFAHDAEAITIQEEGLAIRRRLYGEKHPTVAESTGNLGFALWHSISPPRWKQAERHYRDALAMYRDLGIRESADVARFTFSVGVMLSVQGRFAEAELMYLDALAIYEELPEAQDRYRIECMRKYAMLLEQVGRSEEAEVLLRQTVTLAPQSQHQTGFDSINWSLGSMRLSVRKYEEALRYFKLALMDGCRQLAARNPAQAALLGQLVEAIASNSDDKEAVPKAFALLSETSPSDDRTIMQARVNLASSLHEVGQNRPAMEVLSVVGGIDLKTTKMPFLIASAQSLLGDCLLTGREPESAAKLLRPSYEVIRSFRGETHPQTKLALERLQRLEQAINLNAPH